MRRMYLTIVNPWDCLASQPLELGLKHCTLSLELYDAINSERAMGLLASHSCASAFLAKSYVHSIVSNGILRLVKQKLACTT